jgi:dihydroneopterin aldolase
VNLELVRQKPAWVALGEDIVNSKKHGDRITLAGVKIYPHIGITPEERSTPQECLADLTLWCSFEAAAKTDSLDQSIDYCQVLATMQTVAGAKKYHLLETLAYEIIKNVLQSYPILRARIRLRKRPEILIKDLDFIEVEAEGLQPEKSSPQNIF